MVVKARPSIISKILLGFLVLQFLLIIWLVTDLFWLGKTQRAQDAFDSGRFIKIAISSGEVEGNLTKSKASQSNNPETKLSKALNEEEYRLKRIQELTGKTVDEAKQALDKTANKPAPPTQENKIPVTPNKIDIAIPESIIDKTGEYILPKISDDGSIVPWQYYAKKIENVGGNKTVSIVINNLGLNFEATKQAMELNNNLTLAFSPYAGGLNSQIATARALGFETWLNLPLQHENYPIHDYGNLTLLSELAPNDNLIQLYKNINNTSGIVGLVALPDEKFSRDEQMLEIFEAITKRGLLLTLYNKTFTPSQDKMPFLLHAEPNINGGNIPANLNDLFAGIEAKINNNNHVIITISAMPNVMTQLNTWIDTLHKKNISLVPLSHFSFNYDNKK
jgi:polysaccharide deacetylase 2 family uncharacterized protein YibQ